MGESCLKIKRNRGLVIATLNRVEKLNALNKELFDELNTLVEVLETDKAARVLHLLELDPAAFAQRAHDIAVAVLPGAAGCGWRRRWWR